LPRGRAASRARRRDNAMPAGTRAGRVRPVVVAPGGRRAHHAAGGVGPALHRWPPGELGLGTPARCPLRPPSPVPVATPTPLARRGFGAPTFRAERRAPPSRPGGEDRSGRRRTHLGGGVEYPTPAVPGWPPRRRRDAAARRGL